MRHTLRDFIDELETAGELLRVRERVSPNLEIAARADEESKKPAPNPPSASTRLNDPAFHMLGGRALLFENVEGSDLPVLINAFGSYRRMERAVGCARWERPGGPTGFDAIAARIAELTRPEPPRSAREIMSAVRRFAPLVRIGPRRVRRGRSQEIVLTGDDVDLTRLPIIRCWAGDGDLASVGYSAAVNAGVVGADLADDPAFRGRYITFAHVHTIHADDAGKARPASHNVGMYRVQLIGRRRLVMHWHMHHDGARHWRSWKERGEPMPVVIALGAESVLPFAGVAPLPPGVSELLFAGFLNGRGVPMAPGRTVPVRAPANAEIVIEGFVRHDARTPGWDPRDERAGELGPGAFFEGPFGDHTGFYSLPDRYPLIEVTAVTMRRGAVYPTTVVGLPTQEDYFMGKAVERLFLPLFRTIAPDVADYDLPLFGCFHNCAVLQVKKVYPLQGRRLMHSVWGAGQMAWTKCVIVVDDDVDAHDVRAVLRAMSDHCDPMRDVECVRGPLDILDHAAPAMGAGTKIGFDATRKITGERAGASNSARETGSASVSADQAERTRARVAALPGVRDAALIEPSNDGWLLVSAAEKTDDLPDRIAALVKDAAGRGPRFIITLGADVDVRNPDEALFHWLANSDPGRDRLDFPGGMVFDARPKSPGVGRNGEPTRDWPPIIEGLPIPRRDAE